MMYSNSLRPDLPGEMELLDAKSLICAGRYSDAVREVVTAIEVAVEYELGALYRQRGFTGGGVRQGSSLRATPAFGIASMSLRS